MLYLRVFFLLSQFFERKYSPAYEAWIFNSPKKVFLCECVLLGSYLPYFTFHKTIFFNLMAECCRFIPNLSNITQIYFIFNARMAQKASCGTILHLNFKQLATTMLRRRIIYYDIPT